MKNVLLCFVLLLMLACHKSKDNPNPQAYKHLTAAQIWDSVGFVYEKKYYLLTFSVDTLIFHANNTITESNPDTSITFPFTYTTYDTAIPSPAAPAGNYTRDVYLIIHQTNDSDLHIAHALPMYDYLISHDAHIFQYSPTPYREIALFTWYNYYTN